MWANYKVNVIVKNMYQQKKFSHLQLVVDVLDMELKVSWSRKEILVSSILPQNELENVDFCSSLLGQKFFVRFLGKLKKK